MASHAPRVLAQAEAISTITTMKESIPTPIIDETVAVDPVVLLVPGVGLLAALVVLLLRVAHGGLVLLRCGSPALPC